MKNVKKALCLMKQDGMFQIEDLSNSKECYALKIMAEFESKKKLSEVVKEIFTDFMIKLTG